MAAATISPALSCCCVARRKTPLLLSSPAVSFSIGLTSRVSNSISHLGFGPLPQWRGLKHFGISSQRNYGRKEKKGKCHGKVVYASLFGVGAPEALVIGVVALLVFGPKGLAEVARNLGKTLRAFQPTIRELQEVSREFKSTLEREIGLDEIASSTSFSNKSTSYVNESQQATVDPNGKPSSGAYTSEELLKVTEDQLAQSAAISQTEAAAKPQTEALTTEEKPQASLSSEIVAVRSEITAAPPPEAAAQTPTLEKGENDRS